MKGYLKTNLLILAAVFLLLPAKGGAQNVRDFTDHEPTSEDLISALKPKTRGIALTNEKPQCAIFKEKASRGIDLTPESDVAALKVLFEFNSAELTPEASKTLDKLGEALKSNELGPYCFRVAGHTDGVGAEEYNQSLSERRAQAVADYLAEHFGIDKNRVLAQGYGKKKPIASNDSDEGRQKNRRVEIANLGHGAAPGSE